MLDTAQFRLEVSVNEVDVAQLAPGQPVSVTVDALPEAPLAGRVERLAKDTVKGLRKGAHTVHSPPAIAAVMTGLRSVPRPIFRKLPI